MVLPGVKYCLFMTMYLIGTWKTQPLLSCIYVSNSVATGKKTQHEPVAPTYGSSRSCNWPLPLPRSSRMGATQILQNKLCFVSYMGHGAAFRHNNRCVVCIYMTHSMLDQIVGFLREARIRTHLSLSLFTGKSDCA